MLRATVGATEGVWTYFAVFAALVAAGLGFPIPEEVPVIGGGALAAHASTQVPREHPYWFILWPVCILGVVVSDGLLYGFGRLGGRKLLMQPWFERWFLRPEKRQKTEENIHHYGIWILLAARFMPGIRAGVFVLAGSLKMPLVRFIIADGIYAIPGVSLLFFLSFWFTDRFKDLFERLHNRVEGMVSLLVVVGISAIAGVYAYSYLKRRVDTGDPSEVPILKSVIKPSHDDPPEPDQSEPPKGIAGASAPPTDLSLTRLVIDSMIDHARNELPNECCGLVGGKPNGIASVCLTLENSARSPTRFESSAESILAAHRNLRDFGLNLLAVYHSHPTSDATPSQTDIELHAMPGVPAIIVSMTSDPPSFRAWNLDATPPKEIEIVAKE